MEKRIRVAILGGSALATPKLFQDMALAHASAFYDFVLVGRDEERLQLVEKLSQEVIRQNPGLNARVTFSTQIEPAIEGADYIINQIRVGGLEGRAFDETFPRQFGIPGEETVGPGGFSNSIRGIPVVLNYCRLIEKMAPDAVMLNLTNPSSIIQYAIRKYSKVKVIGTCDAPVSLLEMTARILKVPVGELHFNLAGMHHFTWILGVQHQGVEKLPYVLEHIDEMPKLGTDAELLQALGSIPSTYFKYYAHPDRILAATEGRTIRAHEIMAITSRILQDYRKWKPGDPIDIIDRRGAAWYQKIVAPTLIALAEDRETELILSVDNQDLIPWLPADAVVEVPVPVLNGGLQKARYVDNMPLNLQALISQNAAYEMLTAEAIAEKNRSKAIQALSANLMVQNFNQVQGILKQVWPEEEKHLFKFLTPNSVSPEPAKMVVPRLHFGESLIESINPPEDTYALITMEELWPLVENRFNRKPDLVLFMKELDWYQLEALERALPEIGSVMGLGGGMAQDAAKFVGWKRHIPVDEVVSITSVDASVTKSIAARAGGVVTYIGYKVPRSVYIDYPLIQSAPPRLNRAGAGDILCSHTALWDWKLAHASIGEAYDPEAVIKMENWLRQISENASEIKDVTSRGIRLIMEAFADISILCRSFGSSRPQEGADHAFAYNAEFQTGKKFIHGELVALGAYVIANLQENNPEYLVDLYEKTGIHWHPEDIGLGELELEHTLKTLNWFQNNYGRRYTVLNERVVDSHFIEKIMSKLHY